MHHSSLPDQLVFSIAFAITRSRNLLGEILCKHAADQRDEFARRVVLTPSALGVASE